MDRFGLGFPKCSSRRINGILGMPYCLREKRDPDIYDAAIEFGRNDVIARVRNNGEVKYYLIVTRVVCDHCKHY